MVDHNQTSKDPAKTTPEAFNEFEDARKNQGTGKYPNYWIRKTRSGHVFIFDDSKGSEQITLQHRGGSLIQFMADGAVKHVAHNGLQTIVFGENRITVSGAHDITVKGDASLKVHGNYNATVNGDANFTTKGAFNITSKSMNMAISEQMDVAAGSKMEKIRNSSVTQVHGAIVRTSKYGFTAASIGDAMALGAKTDVGIQSGAQTVIESGGNMSLKSSGQIAQDATNKIYLNSSKAQTVDQVVSMNAVPPPELQPEGSDSAFS